MKIVLNKCYGGFYMTPLAIKEYLKLKGLSCYFYHVDKIGIATKKNYINVPVIFNVCSTKDYGDMIYVSHMNIKDLFNIEMIKRDDEHLIKVIEMLGKDASIPTISQLEVIEVPDNIEFYIGFDKGFESIVEI